MLQHLCVLAALFVNVNDELGKALRGVTAAESYTVTVTERNASVEAQYQKDRPVAFRADRIDFFKKGDVLVYKQAGKWHKSKTGIESDPLLILAAGAKVRGVRLPHEELTGFDKHLKDVTQAKEKGQTVYSATLTEEGARALSKPSDREVARGGTAKLWLDDKGRLVRYETTIRLKGRLGNAEVDGEATKTVSIKDVAATKVDVPDEVKKLLE
jgi:hypothetical protein